MNGQWLRDGDTVAFGRDEFQFKMKLGPKEATAIFERMSRQVSAKEDTVGKGEPVRDATEPKMSLSAKEETEGRTPRAAKEQTDAQTPRSAKEETDVKQPPPAKEETDVPIRSAKEETDVKAPRVAPPEPLIRIPIAYLVPIAGTDANMGAIPIHDETTRLGRDDHWATIALRDSAVSRKHARIVKENAGLRICDERSKAGTQVNDTPIPGDGQLLQEGDKITLGNDEFHFKLSPDAAERAAVAHAASDKPQVSTSAKPAKEATEPRMPIRTKEDTDVSVRE
jgi:pSer/pThr/pTyr-binding forkhead associated (FHA) protein